MYRFERALFYLLILLLPTQLGKHFWPDFSFVSGIRIDYLSPTVYVTDIVLILLFGIFVFRWFITQKKSKAQLKIKKGVFFLGVVLLFAFFNIFFASRPLLSSYGFLKLGEFAFLSFYLVKTIREQSQLQLIACLFAISALGESLLAIAQYVHQGSLNGIFYFFGERAFTGTTPGIANASINGSLVLRPYATFSHPNVLAGYLLVSMILVWSFVLKSKRRWVQVLGAVSLLVSSIALLLTFSRITILLWMLLLLFVLGRMFFQRVKTRRLKIFTGIFIAAGVIVIAMLPVVHEVFFRFTHTSLTEESFVERTELLAAAWIMIQQHALAGVGLDNFIPALAPLQKPLPLNLYLQPVHNIFVLVAAETGIIGLGLFVWLLLATLIRIRKQESGSKDTFFVLITVILVMGMFDHYWLTLQQGQLLFATVIGLCWMKIKKFM